MKKKIITICAVVLFLMALGLTLYPLVSNYVNRKYASEIQTAYQELIQQTDDSVLQEAMQRAIAYNLAITPGTADAYSEEALVTAAEDYGNQLDIAGNGIMGYVEIPKIQVNLREFIQKVKQSKGYLVVILGIGVLLLFLIGSVSSCSVMAGSGISSFVSTSYLSEDKDMLDAESAYCAMEAELQNRLRNYERTHSYDEYHFEMDTIEHDPYVLISLLSALHDGVFTIDQVKDDLNRLFGLQYILTETVETETRYRTETEIAQRPMRDPKTGKVLLDKKGQPIMEDYEVEVEAPYPYTICTVTLKNRNLSHIPVEILGEDGLSMYAAYMATLGNREDLFPNSSYVGKYSETPPKYEIPSEVLADETFSVLITEAEKYIGMPYVWGGSNPNTSFDCSGFICWSMGNSGVWNVGRTSAQGLYNLCTPVAKSNAQPGDLIFFKGTYDTPGISHVGLYVGAGKMLHCGDPIRYVDINTTYWQAHFYAFARPPYQ